MRADTLGSNPKTLRRPNRAAPSILQLGWGHFWLFTAILGGLLGMFGIIFAAHLSTL
jgi:hypothetical protein